MIKRQHLGKQALLAAREQEAAVPGKIARLTGKGAGGAGRGFFDEAVSEFREYGSNIGGANASLSGQDARGLPAQIALIPSAALRGLVQDEDGGADAEALGRR